MNLWSATTFLLIVGSAWAQETSAQTINPATAISGVTVDRKGCFGGCPIYTVTLQRQGASSYIGKTGPRRGLYTAVYGPDFDRLSRAIAEAGFFDLQPEFGAGVKDAEQVIVTVVTQSQIKTVKTLNFSEAPRALWTVVALTDGMAANLPWENMNQPKYGILGPFPLRKVKPEYTEQARNARLQGSVIVQVDIRPDGTVAPESVAVIQGLGMGLDEKAVEAVKQWTFKPAYKDGKPMGITMPISVQVEFRL